jgi:hypothetical protein
MVKPLKICNSVVRNHSGGFGHGRFAFILALAAGLATAHPLSAELPENTAITSHSGQFTVQSVHRQYEDPGNVFRQPVAGGWVYVIKPPMTPQSDDVAQAVDPALLVISCERIKEAILVELNLPDRWQGRIDLNINKSLAENAEPMLRMKLAPEGWRYDLEVPALIKPDHLSQTLVSVLLLEMANRNATTDTTEIPYWLVQGMTAEIHANEPTLLLRPYVSPTGTMLLDDLKPILLQISSQRPNQDPRILARLQRMGSRPLLTFEELSWPTKEQISGGDQEFYQACAHLFLYQLLQLNQGRASLCRFLELLPAHMNWQISFLEAYPSQFTQLRDVEKWWGLARVQRAGQSATRWSADESALHIRELLDVPVQVRATSTDMPRSDKTTLQEIILKWDPPTQTPALQKAIADLATLKSKVTPEFLPLLDRYCRVIESFLKENSPQTLAWMRLDSAPRRAREAAASQLTEADKQLTAMQLRLAASQLVK